MRLVISLLATSFSLLGCVAFHEPLAGSVEPIENPPSDLKAVHVRVRKPEISDPIPAEHPSWSSWPPETLLEFRESKAEHILTGLRDANIFASVAYSKKDDPKNSVVVSPIFPADYSLASGQDVLVAFFTLGILPSVSERDRGVFFEVVDADTSTFVCHWPQSVMQGWLPVLLATGFGSWTELPNEDSYTKQLRRCIARQAHVFSPSRRVARE